MYQRVAALLLFWMVSILAAPVWAEQEPINIGLFAHLPLLMWDKSHPTVDTVSPDQERQRRWRFAEADLNTMSKIGVGWNVVPIRQWRDAPDDLLRVRRVIDQHRARGLKVVFRLLEDHAVYGRLSSTDDATYGYDRDYYRWVQQLAKTFGNEVDYFLIGNECELDIAHGYYWESPDAPEHFTPTFEQYAKLSKTAVKAIRSVSPTVKTANCGFSDYSVALTVADSLLRKEGMDAALAYWRSWHEHKVGPVKPMSSAGLQKLLLDPETRRSIDFVTQGVRDPAGTQLLQVHYYGGWRGLPRTIRWLQDEMIAANSARPIIATEVGYGLMVGRSFTAETKMREYSVADHATTQIKSLALFLRSGTNMALAWPIRAYDYENVAVPLFPATKNPDQFTETAATTAFKTFVSYVNGGRLAAPRLPAATNQWELHVTGRSDVSMVWGDNIDPPANLPAGARLFNVNGQAFSATDRANVRNGVPFYILWAAPAAAKVAMPAAIVGVPQSVGGLPTQTNLVQMLLSRVQANAQPQTAVKGAAPTSAKPTGTRP